jgi:hypothetical protein
VHENFHIGDPGDRRTSPSWNNMASRKSSASTPNQILRTASQGTLLLAFQSIAPGDYFVFTPHCVLNRDYRVHLEHKGR